MARVKSDAVQRKRAMLNTTINAEVLEDFKAHCKELGFPMNVLIEIFMRQMVDDQFVLKFSKNNRLDIDFVEDKDGV